MILNPLVNIFLVTSSFVILGIELLYKDAIVTVVTLVTFFLSWWQFGTTDSYRKVWHERYIHQQDIDNSNKAALKFREKVLQNEEKIKQLDIKMKSAQQSSLGCHACVRKDIQVEELIAKGSYGNVYRAKFKGWPCVVKSMTTASEETLADFYREAGLMARLLHPNINRMKACCVEAPDYLIVLEYATNGSLEDFIVNEDVSPTFTNSLLSIALDTAKALKYIHTMTNPLAHYDVKLHNVFIKDDLTAVLGDFGESRALSMATPFGETKEETKLVGSPYFCAPEILNNDFRDESADIFSFGILLLNLSWYIEIICRCERALEGFEQGKISVSAMLYD